jgi:hypothetical protein
MKGILGPASEGGALGGTARPWQLGDHFTW